MLYKLSELLRIRYLRENPGCAESDATMFTLGYITQFVDNNINNDLEGKINARIEKVIRSMPRVREN